MSDNLNNRAQRQRYELNDEILEQLSTPRESPAASESPLSAELQLAADGEADQPQGAASVAYRRSAPGQGEAPPVFQRCADDSNGNRMYIAEQVPVAVPVAGPSGYVEPGRPTATSQMDSSDVELMTTGQRGGLDRQPDSNIATNSDFSVSNNNVIIDNVNNNVPGQGAGGQQVLTNTNNVNNDLQGQGALGQQVQTAAGDGHRADMASGHEMEVASSHDMQRAGGPPATEADGQPPATEADGQPRAATQRARSGQDLSNDAFMPPGPGTRVIDDSIWADLPCPRVYVKGCNRPFYVNGETGELDPYQRECWRLQNEHSTFRELRPQYMAEAVAVMAGSRLRSLARDHLAAGESMALWQLLSLRDAAKHILVGYGIWREEHPDLAGWETRMERSGLLESIGPISIIALRMIILPRIALRMYNWTSGILQEIYRCDTADQVEAIQKWVNIDILQWSVILYDESKSTSEDPTAREWLQLAVETMEMLLTVSDNMPQCEGKFAGRLAHFVVCPCAELYAPQSPSKAAEWVEPGFYAKLTRLMAVIFPTLLPTCSEVATAEAPKLLGTDWLSKLDSMERRAYLGAYNRLLFTTGINTAICVRAHIYALNYVDWTRLLGRTQPLLGYSARDNVAIKAKPEISLPLSRRQATTLQFSLLGRHHPTLTGEIVNMEVVMDTCRVSNFWRNPVSSHYDRPLGDVLSHTSDVVFSDVRYLRHRRDHADPDYLFHLPCQKVFEHVPLAENNFENRISRKRAASSTAPQPIIDLTDEEDKLLPVRRDSPHSPPPSSLPDAATIAANIGRPPPTLHGQPRGYDAEAAVRPLDYSPNATRQPVPQAQPSHQPPPPQSQPSHQPPCPQPQPAGQLLQSPQLYGLQQTPTSAHRQNDVPTVSWADRVARESPLTRPEAPAGGHMDDQGAASLFGSVPAGSLFVPEYIWTNVSRADQQVLNEQRDLLEGRPPSNRQEGGDWRGRRMDHDAGRRRRSPSRRRERSDRGNRNVRQRRDQRDRRERPTMTVEEARRILTQHQRQDAAHGGGPRTPPRPLSSSDQRS